MMILGLMTYFKERRNRIELIWHIDPNGEILADFVRLNDGRKWKHIGSFTGGLQKTKESGGEFNSI